VRQFPKRQELFNRPLIVRPIVAINPTQSLSECLAGSLDQRRPHPVTPQKRSRLKSFNVFATPDSYVPSRTSVADWAIQLHLGTSLSDRPHVSLMNYTFIPSGEAYPYEQDDCIIMTTSRNTKKFINLSAVPLL